MADRSSDKGIKDMFKQVYDMWEKGATDQLMKVMRNQEFLAAMAMNLERTLNLSGRVKDITQTTLGVMNLPTKQDIDSLSKQVRAMRNAIDEVNEKLDALAPAAPAKAKAKAKKPAKKKAAE